jgi:hypothetical protein
MSLALASGSAAISADAFSYIIFYQKGSWKKSGVFHFKFLLSKNLSSFHVRPASVGSPRTYTKWKTGWKTGRTGQTGMIHPEMK